LNAWLRALIMVGASAIFGAVGALGVVSTPPRGPARACGARRRVALLAMLGSNVESDVGAQFFGFAGRASGYGAARLPDRRGRSAWLGGTLAIIGSWRLARRTEPIR
jgi:hypothetical protein